MSARWLLNIRSTCCLLRLTAMRAVEVLYKPKNQQGCQRRYTTNETLPTMAMKCHRTRMRMRSKGASSCARVASRYFSKHLLRDGSGTKWTVWGLSFELHGVFIQLGHGLCIGLNLITKGPRVDDAMRSSNNVMRSRMVCCAAGFQTLLWPSNQWHNSLYSEVPIRAYWISGSTRDAFTHTWINANPIVLNLVVCQVLVSVMDIT